MFSARRTASALMAAISVAALAACGSAEEGPGPIFDTGPPGSEISDEVALSIAPRVTLTFDITGAKTFSGTTTALAPSGGAHFLEFCDEYAKGTADKQYMAAGLLDGPVDGHKITMEMWIADYAGPGTYPKDQLVAPGSRPSIAIDNTVYGTWPDSTASKATTDGNGGGTWTFKKLAKTGEGGLPGAAISGTVSWTCQEPERPQPSGVAGP
ncbi:hypothetical protein [Actinoplanes sp. NPDC026670]|uniref:hypothetical protein n=1 Tax=Actinoplanes sp. NPDC026670 TaxID=3154700 RepID=UPI0034112F64